MQILGQYDFSTARSGLSKFRCEMPYFGHFFLMSAIKITCQLPANYQYLFAVYTRTSLCSQMKSILVPPCGQGGRLKKSGQNKAFRNETLRGHCGWLESHIDLTFGFFGGHFWWTWWPQWAKEKFRKIFITKADFTLSIFDMSKVAVPPTIPKS